LSEEEEMGESSRLLAQENMSNLWAMLEDSDFLGYGDWERIVTSWFVEPQKRKDTLALLRWARAGRIGIEGHKDTENIDYDVDNPQYELKVPPHESLVGPDYPPYAVPGLPDHLKQLTLGQMGADLDGLRAANQILDIQGYRGSTFQRETISMLDLHESVFIRSLKPGKAFTITGNPGDGKTYAGIEFVVAPALRAGWVVVSNITVKHPPENYHRVQSFAESISVAIGARKQGKRVILLRDEAAMNRKKSDATTRNSRTQKVGSLVFARKLGIVEGLITQLPRDIPTEIGLIRTHIFHKPAGSGRKVMRVMSPTFNGIVTDLPGPAQLKALDRPYLEFDTDDVSPYDVAADIVAMTELEFSTPVPKDVTDPTSYHFDQLKKTIDGLMKKGAKVKNPLTLPQMQRLIETGHLADTRVSDRYYLRFFKDDLYVNGISDRKGLTALLRTWGIYSHPPIPGKACRYCLKYHPELGVKAMRAEPEEEEDDPETSAEDAEGPEDDG